MQLCLFEDDQVDHLRPLVNTRAAYDLRLGIRTLLETTHAAFGHPPLRLHARSHVAPVMAQEYGFPVNHIEDTDVLFVNGRLVAEEDSVLKRLRRAARPNEPGRAFVQGDTLAAAWVPEVSNDLVEAVSSGHPITRTHTDDLPTEEIEGAHLIGRLWHVLDALRPALERDYAARIHYNIYERPETNIHENATLVNGKQIYTAPGTTVQPGAVLNAESGPIYIDENATIMEQAVIRGPAYIGPKSQVKVGANLKACVLGRWCKVGGEVHDSIFHSYSNKAHAGFLGHAYIGRWCNLGADTNNSNLRNDYGTISLYDPVTGRYESTGRQFVGLFMGDHSKTGINFMFNTGTVIGTFCNLYGVGLPPRFLPSFSWGTPSNGFAEYRLEKALRVAEAVMARRDTAFTEADRDMLTTLFEQTRPDREHL